MLKRFFAGKPVSGKIKQPDDHLKAVRETCQVYTCLAYDIMHSNNENVAIGWSLVLNISFFM